MKTLFFIFSVFIAGTIHASVLQVGAGFPYQTLEHASRDARDGDTILVHTGTYSGDIYLSNLRGTPSGWINIIKAPGATVIFSGGSAGWHLSDVAYLYIKGFVFEHQTGNGFNIDDGNSYDTPSHHVILDSCIFRNINAIANNDLLKMSGVDDFEIRNCIFLNGSKGGSGIDMVGCHNGVITCCLFENMGSNSVQAKGGSSNIRIVRNFFRNGGQRTLNLGGSTGLQYFRPAGAAFEASDLSVYSNIIIGSDAPIAFTGCINTEVVNNTIYLPSRWVIRILQENTDTVGFVPCGKNSFINNIIYRDNRISTDCNIGPGTDAGSFTFSNNIWYNPQNSDWKGPVLPVTESNGIISKDPLFADAGSDNFALQKGSPAIGAGINVGLPFPDYAGIPYSNPRSAGALEFK